MPTQMRLVLLNILGNIFGNFPGWKDRQTYPLLGRHLISVNPVTDLAVLRQHVQRIMYHGIVFAICIIIYIQQHRPVLRYRTIILG